MKREIEDLEEKYVQNISDEKQNNLIIPTDKTRKYSGAGKITNFIYNKGQDKKDFSE